MWSHHPVYQPGDIKDSGERAKIRNGAKDAWAIKPEIEPSYGTLIALEAKDFAERPLPLDSQTDLHTDPQLAGWMDVAAVCGNVGGRTGAKCQTAADSDPNAGGDHG